MFIIMHSSGLYFHNKGRIVLFESQQEAQYFLELFSQYSMQRLAQEGRIGEVIGVQMTTMHECKIVSPNFDIEKVECGTVLMSELFKDLER